MWIIYTQHQESNPPSPSGFSPLKSVPLSLNAYTRQYEERNWFFEQLNESSRKIGVLETQLLQLEGPTQDRSEQDINEGLGGVEET